MQPNNTDGFVITAGTRHTAMRLDQFVALECACSRSLAASLIRQQAICVNEQAVKPSYRINAGETISGCIPTAGLPDLLVPEPIPLEILFEDNHLVIINKPPGLVVHPAPGHKTGTLVHGLLFRYPNIRFIGDITRPGIVHRLDKDTSGALIVARSQAAFEKLSNMFAARKILKKYLALIYSVPKEKQGLIQMPIGRHVTNRKKMSTNSRKSRQAETSWRLLKQFDDASLLEATITTGRTHQIRVHLAASGTPIVGDDTYRVRWTKQPANFNNKTVFRRLKDTRRQMLHAWQLKFIHPETGQSIKCTAPLAPDMKQLLGDINRSDRNNL